MLLYPSMSVYTDPRLPVRAIVQHDIEAMRQCLHVYRDPNTTFEVKSWSGPCILTPLGLAVEVCGYQFEHVLNFLVVNAGQNPNTAYEIVDTGKQVCIRTTPLTHLLARWNFWTHEEIRIHRLKLLIDHGADATAPALFKVTPLQPEGQLPPHLRELNDASGQSLMAFQMTCKLEVRTPFYLIRDLIERYEARFRPEDPAGMFARYVSINKNMDMPLLHDIVDFLCPLPAQRRKNQKIAGGILKPGEAASGELSTIVRGFDQRSGTNILHMYVELYSESATTNAVERLCMLRDVYGLRLLTPTLDGRGITSLATQRRVREIESEECVLYMREAVAIVIEDEFLLRHRALAVAQGLRNWPLLVMYKIGLYSELPIQGAHQLNMSLLKERQKSFARSL